jgi:uncharacterized protein involved in response to NO
VGAPPDSTPRLAALAADPYRLFFPLGAVLGAVGVGRLTPAVLASPGPAGLVFHSATMIEGFLSAFAFGFLLTFIPRRTGTAPPAPWQLGSTAAALVVAVLGAGRGHEAAGHLAWLAALAVVLGFALPRLARAGALARVPGAFLWVVASLAAGGAGAAITASAARLPPPRGPLAWALGRALLLQGLVPGLAVGVGAILLPQLTRGEAPPPRFEGPAARRAWILHAVAAAAFLASFPLEILEDQRAGLALRGAVALSVLVLAARIHRPPTEPGLHRTLLWIAAWLLPMGWLAAGLWPRLRGAALHIGFVGGFALMTLAVSFHVVLSHAGRPEVLHRTPPLLRALAGCLAAALAARLLVGLDPDRAPLWTSVAAVLFLAALAVWAGLVGGALRPRSGPAAPG